MFFDDQVFNPFMGGGALTTSIDDYNGDNFDHAGLGFIGGAYLAAQSNGSHAYPLDQRAPGHPALGRRMRKRPPPGTTTATSPSTPTAAARAGAAIISTSTRLTATPTACRCCA